MDLGLEGKVAWVLGASSGLGRATAAALAGEGARVAISARTPDTLRETAEELGCTPFPLDVTDAPAIEATEKRIASELGPIDILVANAGGPPPGGFSAHDERALQQAFELTTASAWRLTKSVTESMKERGRGCVIYVTSWSTKEVIDNLLLSNMMRSAVTAMSKTLARELGPHGVRVLCVAPGRMDTPRLRALDEATAAASSRSVDEVSAESRQQIPLRRYGRPEEFGEVVAFLASDRASYVTGITVVVDGGMLRGVLS